MQQIQASEGQPALIQVGQSIPITSTSTDGYGRLQSNTEYRNVTQGFYVTQPDRRHGSPANQHQ
jgi:type II secretory pathway component GspD/PulD (secretin)